MSQKRPRSPSPVSHPTYCLSKLIEDRSSRFQAVYSPTLSVQQLRALPECENATHLMAAWRKPSTQRNLKLQSVTETGYDDDGEKYGGKTIEKVLVSLSVEGAVVVARWYGGVMLGPVRFDHIKDCTSQAVRRWKVLESEGQAKKARLESEGQDKAKLVEVLHERDKSVAILRDLLAEKTQPKLPSPGCDTVGRASLPDYETLPITTLQKLEMVRDRTIGWVLQEIEKAEEMEDKDQDAANPTKLSSKAQRGDVSTSVEQINGSQP